MYSLMCENIYHMHSTGLKEGVKAARNGLCTLWGSGFENVREFVGNWLITKVLMEDDPDLDQL